MGWDWGLNVMPLGPRLQKHRMLLHQFLHARTAMKRNHDILTLETHRLISGLFDSPDNYLYHVRRYGSPTFYKPNSLRAASRTTAAIIMKIAYGYEGIPSHGHRLSLPHISFS